MLPLFPAKSFPENITFKIRHSPRPVLPNELLELLEKEKCEYRTKIQRDETFPEKDTKRSSRFIYYFIRYYLSWHGHSNYFS
jgi:hypothetical protein